MKKYFLITFSLCSLYLFGQTTVISDDYLINTRADGYQWTINGVSFLPTDKETTIYPHEQCWDTIIFLDKYNLSQPDTIFSIIQKNQKYIMAIGCCDEYFEMHNINKKYPDVDIDITDIEVIDTKTFMKLTSQDYGQVKFVILNKPDTDTLVCVYSGGGFRLVGQMITDNSDNGWLIPIRNTYSSNNGIVTIARKNKKFQYENYEDEDVYLGKNLINWDYDSEMGLEILKQFRLRLFNQEKVIVEFNYLTKKTKLIVVD